MTILNRFGLILNINTFIFRSSSKARLRKPKVKDLKHVETLRH